MEEMGQRAEQMTAPLIQPQIHKASIDIISTNVLLFLKMILQPSFSILAVLSLSHSPSIVSMDANVNLVIAANTMSTN